MKGSEGSGKHREPSRVDRRAVLATTAAATWGLADATWGFADGALGIGNASANQSEATSSGSDDPDTLRAIRFLIDTAWKHTPRRFEDDDHWGGQKRVFDGVSVKWRDGRLRTHRKWKDRNHGRWVRWAIDLPADPDILSADPGILPRVDIRDASEDAERPGRFRYDVAIDLPCRWSARIQRWNRGLRLASVTVEGHATLHAEVTVDVAVTPDYTRVPPGLVIDPNVRDASVSLPTFEVDRVSHADGPAAEAWGEVVQETVVRPLVRRHSRCLADDLNRHIDRRRDDLRLHYPW